ncbi:MAG: CoA-binding protein [Actinobacteria bacterium]|nr:CoA-binding protein [Actinomycetota bacterium]
MNNAEIKSILEEASSVAVIGVSSNPERASHQVAAYLIEQTHLDVYLINPTATGEDMPAVFEAEFPAIAESAAGKTWWMQLGIENDDVAKLAEASSMKVIMDRCIKVDYQNLIPAGK